MNLGLLLWLFVSCRDRGTQTSPALRSMRKRCCVKLRTSEENFPLFGASLKKANDEKSGFVY